MGAATLDGSEAILKTKYTDGRLPSAQYEETPFQASLQHKEDFDGENMVIALQTENPQGSSGNFQIALAALQQSTYVRFLLERSNHYGIARVTGEALEAAKNKSGALVDLWENETNCASAGELKSAEIYSFGDGTGVLGQISAASSTASVTITLSQPADVTKLDFNMSIQVVSDATMSPTTLPGIAKVIGLNRDLGTVTLATTWAVAFPGITTAMYIVRAGDSAALGVNPSVLTGVKQWVQGGATPGTLWGLNRNPDPVRYAGQSLDLTGIPMEDALIQMAAKRRLQYRRGSMVCWVNTEDLAQLVKSLGGKATYPKTEMKSSIADVSFEAVEFDGSGQRFKIMDSPFVTVGDVLMLTMDSFAMNSLGPAPHMLNFDGPNFLRVASDDAYEVRFALRGNIGCNMPVASIRGTNWGVSA